MIMKMHPFFFVLFFFCVTEGSNSILNDVISEDLTQSKHHKVHNLILNPDQHSWCELKEIKQIVTHANCQSQEMENFVCVGTCFSYSVPQTEPETPGDEMLDYCDSCQPAESYWTTVVLDCEDDGTEYQVTKNIQRITNCSCSTCRPSRKSSPNNEVIRRGNEQRGAPELIYKMIADTHPLMSALTGVDDNHDSALDEHRFSQLSLRELKKEMKLNASQEMMLSGKRLMKDIASFRDAEKESDPLRSFLSTN